MGAKRSHMVVVTETRTYRMITDTRSTLSSYALRDAREASIARVRNDDRGIEYLGTTYEAEVLSTVEVES